MMKNSITIYPEIAASILSNKEEDVFFIWLLAKKVDESGNGIVPLKKIFEIANEYLGLKSNYIYTKIEKGIDLFWRKPFGKHGNKFVCLLSIDKITKRLKPEITRVKPVIVPLFYFKSDGFINSKNLRNMLIGIVAARYTDERPISFYSLIHNMKLSESSIRNAIKDCPFVKTKRNYKVICEDETDVALKKIMQKDKEPWACRIVNENGRFILLKQLANSYSLNEFDRLPLSKRPKELKRIDKVLLNNLQSCKFFTDGLTRTVENNDIITIPIISK